MSLADNIENVEVLPDEPENLDNVTPPAKVEDSIDDYLSRFDAISDLHEKLTPNLEKLLKVPHDEDRVSELVKFVVNQQKVNEEVYALLVDMNNLFVEKDKK